mgnify:CR=1 FL=1
MKHSTPTIGLISGLGELPKAIALDARGKGYNVICIALENLSGDMGPFVDVLKWSNAGKVSGMIEFFKKNGVRDVVIAGKVPKTLLYKGGLKPDMRALKMLFSLKDKSDGSILSALSKELEKEDMRLLRVTDFSTGLLTPEGVLTKKSPSKKEAKDIEFGFRFAKAISGFHIGQTVVVKNGAIMAVEAIEGTDEAIKRGGELAGGGATVVKVSNPAQDMRFDVPVVGIETLDAMLEAGIAVLAAEAHKSIFLQRDEFISRADKSGIKVVGIKGE